MWSGVNADEADAKLISEVPYGDNSLQKIYTNLAQKTTRFNEISEEKSIFLKNNERK